MELQVPVQAERTVTTLVVAVAYASRPENVPGVLTSRLLDVTRMVPAMVESAESTPSPPAAIVIPAPTETLPAFTSTGEPAATCVMRRGRK